MSQSFIRAFSLLLAVVGLYLSRAYQDVLVRLLGFILAILGSGWFRAHGLGRREGWRFAKQALPELGIAGVFLIVSLAIIALGDESLLGYLEEQYIPVVFVSVVLLLSSAGLVYHSISRTSYRDDDGFREYVVRCWPTAVGRQEPERTTGIKKSRRSNGVFKVLAFE